ncbi:hypothetical protein Droror1_Dr00016137 [Drosera rotundifolia]
MKNSERASSFTGSASSLSCSSTTKSRSPSKQTTAVAEENPSHAVAGLNPAAIVAEIRIVSLSRDAFLVKITGSSSNHHRNLSRIPLVCRQRRRQRRISFTALIVGVNTGEIYKFPGEIRASPDLTPLPLLLGRATASGLLPEKVVSAGQEEQSPAGCNWA